MRIELINTGTELMLGRVLNSHQQWLCRQFADRGYVVDRQVAVDDSGPAIQAAVREALSRADLVITTGGLGPTSDDRTRDLIASLLGRRLVKDEFVAQMISDFFTRRQRPMSASTLVQAMVPEGAVVLHNFNGTAPGLALRVYPNPFRTVDTPAWLIMLPGPPRELRPMFEKQAAPLIQEKFPLPGAFVCRTLRTTGMGESLIADKVEPPLRHLLERGVEVGYCARTGEVDVRLTAHGPGALERVAEGETILRGLIGDLVYGVDDEELHAVVIRLLTERRLTLALAESCTGGYIAHRLTNVSGASAVLQGGVVSYSNAAKQQLLGVNASTLAEHGAVSEPVAREMAAGARRVLGADLALSVTGIAGPTGGTPEKPVGTVFVGLATARGVEIRKFYNPVDRETFKFVTSQQALEWLRRAIVGG